jgi:hypothetical protein
MRLVLACLSLFLLLTVAVEAEMRIFVVDNDDGRELRCDGGARLLPRAGVRRRALVPQADPVGPHRERRGKTRLSRQQLH